MESICVFCEGKTEINYLESLNRFLEENDIYELKFTGKYLEGVKTKNYKSHLEKRYKPHKLKMFDKVYMWIDFDIFKRENINEEDIKKNIKEIKFNKKSVIPLFNKMNGEDFIMLHNNDDNLKKWINICNRKNHFENPMIKNQYMKEIKKIIPDYSKTDPIDITEEKLEICINNIENKDIPFSSGAVLFLKMVMKLLKEDN